MTRNQYRELKYFCLQYCDKKKQLQEITYSKAINQTGMPYSTNTGNPTSDLAIRIAQLKKDIELIEQTAIEVTQGDSYIDLLSNVTKGVAFEYLDIPMSRRNFYRLRERFFYLLATKKKII